MPGVCGGVTPCGTVTKRVHGEKAAQTVRAVTLLKDTSGRSTVSNPFQAVSNIHRDWILLLTCLNLDGKAPDLQI